MVGRQVRAAVPAPRGGDQRRAEHREASQAGHARNGEQQSSLEIEAVHVGHDLTRGTSQFTRTPKAVQETAA